MPQRNLIVMLGHGLRDDVVGDGDAWPMCAPFLKTLADRGLRLTANSACPSDPGGELSLFTGLHARQHGALESSACPLASEGWASSLLEAGYFLSGVGRVGPIEPWLHESVFVDDPERIESHRCSYLRAIAAEGLESKIVEQRRRRRRAGPFDPARPELSPEQDIDGFIAQEAERRLEAMPTDRPWCLVVCFSGPGNELAPPPLYERVVDPQSVRTPFVPADLRQLDAMLEPDYPRVLLQRMDVAQLARIRADYLGRVSLFDHGVGRLTTRLEHRPDRARTWTLLGADRGLMLGEHGVVGRRSFLRGAVQTPLLLAPPTPLPAKPQKPQIDGFFSTVDLASTVADLAGVDALDASPGRSLLTLLRGGEDMAVWRRPLISEFGRRLMIETERHKAVFHTRTRKLLALYDLVDDPEETCNLVGTAHEHDLADAMRWRLADALIGLRAVSG